MSDLTTVRKITEKDDIWLSLNISLHPWGLFFDQHFLKCAFETEQEALRYKAIWDKGFEYGTDYEAGYRE